jgi:hypothetical protein
MAYSCEHEDGMILDGHACEIRQDAVGNEALSVLKAYDSFPYAKGKSV